MPKVPRTFLGHVLRASTRWWRTQRALHALQRRFPTAHIEANVQVKNAKALTLGNDTVVQWGTVLHCGGQPWSNGKGFITVGDRTLISPHCVLYGAGGIEVGADVEIGVGAAIFSSESDLRSIQRPEGVPHLFKPVTIGRWAAVGAGAVVTPGVQIGEGAIVGAQALVRKDVPAYAIVAGVPARVIGDRRTTIQGSLVQRDPDRMG